MKILATPNINTSRVRGSTSWHSKKANNVIARNKVIMCFCEVLKQYEIMMHQAFLDRTFLLSVVKKIPAECSEDLNKRELLGTVTKRKR